MVVGDFTKDWEKKVESKKELSLNLVYMAT